MKLKFYFLCFTVFYSFFSSAQSIKGFVTSSDGKGIAFANISIQNSSINTTTDKAGIFSLKLPAGEYNIIATAVGYIASSTTFKTGETVSTVSIVLQANTAILNEVVITGTKTAVAKNYVPFNISVVNRQQIENSSESSLFPVLSQQVPGLFVTERGVTGFGVGAGSAGAISMRGISGSPNNRILVLINGSPQFMGIFGHPLADAYVAADVEKVEVIHGPGSVLYGTNAMGGVINIITRNQLSDGYNLNTSVTYGSFNTQKYMASIGYRKKKFSAMASFNKDQTDGHRPSSNFNITNGYLKLNYRFSDHLTVGAETNIAKFYAADPGPIYGQPGSSIDIYRAATYLNVTNTFKNTSGNVQLFYNNGDHKIADGFRSKDANYGLLIYQSFRYIKNNVTTAGFDFKNYGGKASNIYAMNGQGVVFGDHTITEWAPYLFSQQNINSKLILSAGIRQEHNSVYGNILIPSGGISYLANTNTTIKAAVSKGFRSPTMLELYLFVPANPLLQPEKMMNYEVSVNQYLADKKIKLEFTVFKVQGDNLIQTARINGAPRNINTGSFTNTGIEFAASYAVNNQLNLSTVYGYTDMKVAVTAAPKHHLVIAANFTTQKWQLNASVENITGLYTQVMPFVVQTNYYLFNAKAGYKICSLFQVFLKGENLTNQQYQINSGYPMPGITLLGGVNFHFKKQA